MAQFLKDGKLFPKMSSDIKSLVKTNFGRKVFYVLERDIDKSGRGYFSIRYGDIMDCHGKNIQIDQDWFFWKEIREYSFSEIEE